MTESEYQKEIYRVYDTTNSNIFIKAEAGAGKTTTLCGIVNRTPPHKSICFISFNNSIVDEIKNRIKNQSNVRVSTIHSLAYSILRRNMNRNFKVVDNKSFLLGKRILNLDKFKTEKEKNYYLFQMSKLYDFCRLNLVSDREDIEQIATEYGVSILNGEIEDCLKLFSEIEKYNNKPVHKEFMIDFTDMIWLTYQQVNSEDYVTFNILLVDEVQDVSPLQREFIDRLTKKNSRSVFVGDDKQIIYQFIGSNLKSFRTLQERKNTITLPLSVTYRCARKIVEEANKVFEGLQVAENAIEGEVKKGTILEAESGDFIICRNNLPLVQSFLTLLENKKKSFILGKDFGESLVLLINKLKKYSSFEEGQDIILQHEEEKLKEKGIINPTTHPKYGGLFEKLQIVNILQIKLEGLTNLSNHIEEIFSDNDKSEGICLMTIHKSKGRESKNCFLLGNDELLPSKYAKNKEMLYAEKCLLYVSLTRAKEKIIFCNLK